MFFLASTKNCAFENCHPHIVENPSLDYCSYPLYLCDNNTNCIEAEMLCDGKKDCLDGSDEGGLCCKSAILYYHF